MLLGCSYFVNLARYLMFKVIPVLYLNPFYNSCVNQTNRIKLPELITVVLQPPINRKQDKTIIGVSIYKDKNL